MRSPASAGSRASPWTICREIVRYWLDAYDWRVHEARLNRYRQFVTTVDGQRIHFLHVRSRHQAAIPLFLIHGWPGSVVEFLDVIDPLADPANPSDAFHLVVPSLPGYGFSGPTTETGWNPQRIAAAFGQIADRLGYRRYGVQGGDWGAIVSANMAELRPDRTLGLHVNLMNVPPPSGEAAAPPTAWARRAGAAGGGYEAIQGTRPQTIGYLLDDSPAGLAAWLDREVSRVDRRPEQRRRPDHGPAADQRDALLGEPGGRVVGPAVLGTTPGLFFFPPPPKKKKKKKAPETMVPQRPVTVPTGVANYPGELVRSLRPHAERFFNIAAWTELPRGGHFPAMEVPDLFVADVRAFFRPLRQP